jgi:hypothetical protein
MLSNSEYTFYATNTISPKDWPAQSCEQQKKARVRHIFRVMLWREDDKAFNSSLDDLAKRQHSECGVKSLSHYLKEDLYANFQEEMRELGHIDLVLADNSVLLLTNYDEEEKFIRNGIITIDPKMISAARKLFVRLQDEAIPYAFAPD